MDGKIDREEGRNKEVAEGGKEGVRVGPSLNVLLFWLSSRNRKQVVSYLELGGGQGNIETI